MLYIIPVSIIIAGVVIYIYFNSRRRRTKRLERLRRSWGIPKEEPFDFDLIDRYSRLGNGKSFHRLTEQTLRDIDLREVFTFIDRTTSRIGQQYLFDKVTQPDNDLDRLRCLNSKAQVFSGNVSLRERVQIELLRLNSDDAYYVSSLLQDRLVIKPSWFPIVFASIVSLVALLILSVKYPPLIIFAIIPAGANIFIHYWNKGNVNQFLRSFPQLNLLIDVCRKISKIDICFYDKYVDESIRSLKAFQIKSSFLGYVRMATIQDELTQVVTYLVELLKAILLIEVFTLFHLAFIVEMRKKNILCLFTFVGEIDSAMGVASLRAGSLKTCEPCFIEAGKGLTGCSIYHPLIKDCIKNDILIQGRGVLITGSNMSGKTSFLRTIILNSILAQTIFTCFADEFTTPVLKQFSSIRVDDSLLEGKSYYLEEVNVMASLIAQVDRDQQNIFVLDEVFKGTNTVERIASAKAILSYLIKNSNIVIVSTHDIELCSLLKREYDMYHFADTIESNELCFDYRLKIGPLETRNAIRLLEVAGYPKKVVDEARVISAILETALAKGSLLHRGRYVDRSFDGG